MKMLNAIEKTCAVIGAITIVCLVAGAVLKLLGWA